MGSEGWVVLTFPRRAAWLTTAAVIGAAAAVAMWGWSPMAPRASAVQAAPAPIAPVAPLQVIAPDAPCPGDTRAAVDYFLKLDGIDGEATAAGFERTIQIESWSWGASQAGAHGAGGGGGAGKVSFSDFHFVKKVDKASPQLFLKCATGQHIKEAKLTARKAGGTQEPYMTVTLSDVLISSYQTGASSGDVVPTDQVSLNFTKIELSVRPVNPDGSLGPPVTTRYDLKAGRGG